MITRLGLSSMLNSGLLARSLLSSILPVLDCPL